MNKNVLAYLEPVTGKNLSMVKMMLLAFDGQVLEHEIIENKALIVLKGFGSRPLPILPGFKITVCNPDIPPQSTPPSTTTDCNNINSLFDKNVESNVYKYNDFFKHYLNPSITIPAVASILMMYTCYKLFELML